MPTFFAKQKKKADRPFNLLERDGTKMNILKANKYQRPIKGTPKFKKWQWVNVYLQSKRQGQKDRIKSIMAGAGGGFWYLLEKSGRWAAEHRLIA